MKKVLKTCAIATALIALAGCSHFARSGSGQGNSNGSDGSSVNGIADNADFNGQANGGLTPQLQSVVSKLPSKVYFGFDQYNLDAKAVSVVNQNAQVLLQNPGLHVLLTGNTDPRGSQEYNFHLGQRRANAVRDYFLQQGVAAKQICTVSYGELRPAANPAQFGGNVQKAYALDRRTEIVYGQTCQGSAQ